MASRYQPGDRIVLRPRTLSSVGQNVTGNVVAVLPETQGSVRYRVRLEGEAYDRNISEDDIDVTSSAERRSADRLSEPATLGSSWINTIGINTRK